MLDANNSFWEITRKFNVQRTLEKCYVDDVMLHNELFDTWNEVCCLWPMLIRELRWIHSVKGHVTVGAEQNFFMLTSSKCKRKLRLISASKNRLENRISLFILPLRLSINELLNDIICKRKIRIYEMIWIGCLFTKFTLCVQ